MLVQADKLGGLEPDAPQVVKLLEKSGIMQSTPVQPDTHTHIQEEPLYCNLSPPGAVHVGGCVVLLEITAAKLCCSSATVTNREEISCSVRKVLFSTMPACATMGDVATIAPPPSGRSVILPPNVLVSITLPFALKYKGNA